MRKLIVALTLVVASCAPTPPPIVTPQPPPPVVVVPPVVVPTRVVTFVVRGSNGHTPDGTVVNLSDDTPIVMPCAYLPPDVFQCTVDPRVPFGSVGFHIDIDAKDYDHYRRNFLFTGFSMDVEEVHLTETVKPLPRLVRYGDHIRKATGERHAVIEASEFNAFGRYENGEDVEPLLRQVGDEIGFNTIRVFTAYDVCATGNGCQPIGRLNPAEHPTFCADLQLFARLANKHNLYVEYVAFTGPYDSFFTSDDAKVVYWELFKHCTAPSTNVMDEMVNEWDHVANNHLPFDRLTRPDAPIFASHGSATQDGPLIQPLWDYVTTHYAGVRKVAHNPMEDVMWPFNMPATANETQRFPDQDNGLVHAFDMGRGCVGLTSGCAFHSVEGKNARLFDLSLSAAREFVRGARSVDLVYQDGQYRHRLDLETPDIERFYSVVLAGYPELLLPMHY